MGSLSAAVIGLGQAGSRFDEEPRPSVWSHVGAYLALPELYQLVGGADSGQEQRDRFHTRCPGLPVFADAVEMLSELKPDIVSICTPHHGRAKLVESLLQTHKPLAMISEKPLEADRASRERLVALCHEANIPLFVHYNRRYQLAFHKCKQAMADGRLGRIVSITILAPNRLFSIGSHAVNTLLYLADGAPLAWTTLGLPSLQEGGEEAADLLCRFADGLAGRVITAGFKQNLVFEIDILGTQGRIRILDNGKTTLFEPFADSLEYVGYKILQGAQLVHSARPDESSFLAIALETAKYVLGRDVAISSSAEEAMVSESLLDDVIAKAKQEAPPS